MRLTDGGGDIDPGIPKAQARGQSPNRLEAAPGTHVFLNR